MLCKEREGIKMQKKKGISLIVLIITIIVMIILAAVVIISLNNSGIIKRANSAVESYNEDEVNHVASLAWSEAYLDGARTVEELKVRVRAGLTDAGLNPDDYGMIVTTSGVTITKGWLQDGVIVTRGNVTLEAGDRIQYDAGVQGYEGKWEVLGAENGKLLIMSTMNIGSLQLYGLEGGTYQDHTTNYGLLNGIKRLNELCEPYGHGTGAVGARSIKVEDVNKLTGYDPTTYGVGTMLQYGNKVTFSWNTTTDGDVDYISTNGQSGTLISSSHSEGFSYIDFNTMAKTTVPVNGSGMPTLINTSYQYELNDTTLPTKSHAAVLLLSTGVKANGGHYWLASPYISSFYTFGSSFGLLSGSDGVVAPQSLFYSAGEEAYRGIGIRAVVEISPSITIGTKNATNGWSYTI